MVSGTGNEDSISCTHRVSHAAHGSQNKIQDKIRREQQSILREERLLTYSQHEEDREGIESSKVAVGEGKSATLHRTMFDVNRRGGHGFIASDNFSFCRKIRFIALPSSPESPTSLNNTNSRCINSTWWCLKQTSGWQSSRGHACGQPDVI